LPVKTLSSSRIPSRNEKAIYWTTNLANAWSDEMGLDSQAIIDAVEKKSPEIVGFTRDLIKVPSINPPGLERECAKIIFEKMKEAGLEVSFVEAVKGRPNVVGVLSGSHRSPNILFNGHMDVVPIGDAKNWSFDPFSGKISNGCIYGRGACDMKSGLAAMIMSALILKQERVKINGNLLLTAVVDEEMLGDLGTKYLIKNKFINPDMAVVCEPTDMRIVIAHKGLLWTEITVKGRASHGSRPWMGVNAIYGMNEVIAGMKRYEEQLNMKASHSLLGRPTINIGTIEGGIKTNVVPDVCRITVDRRLIPGERIEDVYREIANVLEEVKVKQPSFQVEMKKITHALPVEISQNERIVEIAKNAFQAVKGIEPKICGQSGATDATHIVNDMGVPTVVLGPGNAEKCSHTVDEHVEVKQLIDATKIYALIAIETLR